MGFIRRIQGLRKLQDLSHLQLPFLAGTMGRSRIGKNRLLVEFSKTNWEHTFIEGGANVSALPAFSMKVRKIQEEIIDKTSIRHYSCYNSHSKNQFYGIM